VCNNSGFKGRQGIFELMMMHAGMHDAIVHRAGAHEFQRLAREGGLVPMWDYGMAIASQGATTLQELLRVTRVGH
jgi:type II secretory ATPase GspE/PulE/Tfp pilus assembly ATPase PilB-like protein